MVQLIKKFELKAMFGARTDINSIELNWIMAELTLAYNNEIGFKWIETRHFYTTGSAAVII